MDNARHISPFAEEFYEVMGLGQNEKQIQALDVAGVALKVVQEQQTLLLKQQELIEELQRQIAELKQN